MYSDITELNTRYAIKLCYYAPLNFTKALFSIGNVNLCYVDSNLEDIENSFPIFWTVYLYDE